MLNICRLLLSLKQPYTTDISSDLAPVQFLSATTFYIYMYFFMITLLTLKKQWVDNFANTTKHDASAKT